ncbi:MAG TPA: hypothetical protein VLA48_02640 [Nitrososphaeraceae archaeon]|nr:hypothetical protein [Nitrososphaeraceae archaeon]
MKKVLLGAILVFSMLSCTDNQRARSFGGEEVVELPENRILLNATWKESNLWVLTKDTLTNEIFFNEKSSWGALEGTIKFKNK